MAGKTIEWVKIKESRTSGGKVVVEAYVPSGPDPDDVEPLGELDLVQSLGMTARPHAEDASGSAEALVVRGAGGRRGIAFALQDNRYSAVADGLEPGDVVFHSVGPQKSAQVRLSDKKRRVTLATKGSNGKDVVFDINGDGDKLAIAGFGGTIQISSKGIVLAFGSTAILIDGSKIRFLGEVSLPGMTPGMSLLQGLLETLNTSSAPIAVTKVKGVGK